MTKHSEAKQARGRLEAWAGHAELPGGIENDIAAVCAWTHHWETTLDELDRVMAEELERIRRDLVDEILWIEEGKPDTGGAS